MASDCDTVSEIDDKLQAWIRRQLDNAVKGFIESELYEDALIEVKPAWVLPSQLLIGKVREQSNPISFRWFICGEVPLDHMDSNAATTPREAIRHFALKWQLEAANLKGDGAAALIEQAESLYPLADDGRLWR